MDSEKIIARIDQAITKQEDQFRYVFSQHEWENNLYGVPVAKTVLASLQAARAMIEDGLYWRDNMDDARQGIWILGKNEYDSIRKICWLSTTADGGHWIDENRKIFKAISWCPIPTENKAVELLRGLE